MMLLRKERTVEDPHPVWRAVRAAPRAIARALKVLVVGLPWHSRADALELQRQIDDGPGARNEDRP